MKLIFEFTKSDNMIYISHLDLMRLLLRVLRMSGLRPAYSQGFNPHPKMSLALPLSLGLYSTCELLEFETSGAGRLNGEYLMSSLPSEQNIQDTQDTRNTVDVSLHEIAKQYQCEQREANHLSVFPMDRRNHLVADATRKDNGGIVNKNRNNYDSVQNPVQFYPAMVNERLPDGIRITSCWEKPLNVKKPLASYVTAAVYEFMCEGVTGAPGKLAAFFERKNVTVRKLDKKAGMEKDKEIRDSMLGYRIVKDMRGRMLAEATLAAAPGRTLSPLVFFGAFCEASGLEADALSPVVTRTAIIGANGRALREVLK